MAAILWYDGVRKEGGQVNTLTLLSAAAEQAAGSVIWLVLLIVGFGLVVLEIYLPGFGLPGILGGICLIAGVALKAQSDLIVWLVMTLVIAALLCVVLSISMRSASKGRLDRSRFVLRDVATTSQLSGGDMAFYVGKSGVTTTALRPSGNAEIDGVKLNVLSDGEFIAEGERVKVVSVEGNRILVRWEELVCTSTSG